MTTLSLEGTTMNSQFIKNHQITSHAPHWFVSVGKITTGKSTIKVSQLYLISRIMVSLVTIGLIGYSYDRVLQSIQKSSPSG
jgi:hypothetical protein